MVNTRSTDSRIDSLEKAVEGLTSSLDDRISKCLEDKLGSLLDIKLAPLLKEFQKSRDSGGSYTPPQADSTDMAEQQQTDSATHGPDVVAASGQPPSNSLMSLPSFDGNDALGWLARADQFFMVNKTPDGQRLDIAIIALAGPALPWFQILRRRRPSICWEQFASELLQRFGEDNARNSYEAFAATKHRGALPDYIMEFESKLAQLPDLTDTQYMGFFLANLKPQLRAQLQDLSIHTYSDAVHMAKRLDRLTSPASYTNKSSSGTSFTHPIVTNHSSSPVQGPPHHQQEQHSSASATSSGRAPNRFRNMSSDEYRKHLAAGTCFKCGQRYSPTHRCPPKTLQVIVGNDDEDDSDGEIMTEETPALIPEGPGRGCQS